MALAESCNESRVMDNLRNVALNKMNDDEPVMKGARFAHLRAVRVHAGL